MNYRLKGASGALTGQTFELAEVTTVGSAPGAGIRIEGLEPEHARIASRDGGLVIEALGECVLNGEPVTEAALTSGDELRIGNARLVLQAPGVKPARVLDRVPVRPRGSRIGWIIGGATVAAGAFAAWWWLAQTGG